MWLGYKGVGMIRRGRLELHASKCSKEENVEPRVWCLQCRRGLKPDMWMSGSKTDYSFAWFCFGLFGVLVLVLFVCLRFFLFLFIWVGSFVCCVVFVCLLVWVGVFVKEPHVARLQQVNRKMGFLLWPTISMINSPPTPHRQYYPSKRQILTIFYQSVGA